MAVHVEPVPADVAADRLRRQLARLESGRRADAAKGRLVDPDVEVAAADARELAAGLARGEQKLFRVGLYLTVHAASEKALEAECARVRAICASMLLDAQAGHLAHPARLDLHPAGRGRRPRPAPHLRHRRPGRRRFRSPRPSCPPTPASSTAPLPAARGWCCGTASPRTTTTRSSWPAPAPASRYLAKLEALRSLYAGIEVAVVDPEDEYRRLAETVGGAYVHLGAPGVRVNPFDLQPGPDALTRRALFVHTLIAVLLGGKPDPAATAALDRGIVAAYESVGITADPRSHARPHRCWPISPRPSTPTATPRPARSPPGWRRS